MALYLEGDFREEEFQLPNGYSIKINYGLLDVEGLQNGIPNEFLNYFTRYSGQDRRSILFDESYNIITQCIEKNPNFLDDELANVHKDGLLLGDDFERVIHFDNGMIAKIEYWKTLNERDENFGTYAAKFRRLVLFNENQEIISELFERNPDYRPTGNKVVIPPNSEDYDLRMLL